MPSGHSVPRRILDLALNQVVVGLHMTNPSQQECDRNAENPVAVLRTARAPGLVPVGGNGVY